MGYRTYVHIPEYIDDITWSSEDTCLGKLYGYVETELCMMSLRQLVAAMRETDETDVFWTNEPHSCDIITDFPCGVPIIETFDSLFDSSFRFYIKMSVDIFKSWIFWYYDEQRMRFPHRELCKTPEDAMKFWGIKTPAWAKHIYVYIF